VSAGLFAAVDKAQTDLGSLLETRAREAISTDSTEKAWKELKDLADDFVGGLIKSSDLDEQKLGLRFSSILGEMKDRLKISRVGDNTLPDAIQCVLRPSVVSSLEKARRMWLPATRSPVVRFPNVAVLAQYMPKDAQDIDLWGSTDVDAYTREGHGGFVPQVSISINFVSAAYTRQPRPVLEWLCRQGLLIAHEAHHAVVLQLGGTYGHTCVDNTKPLHGWLFFLSAIDSLERAKLRSDASAVESINKRCLDQIVTDTPGLGNGGEADATVRGWVAAKQFFEFLDDFAKDASALPCSRSTCPYYGSTVGMTPYVAFHIFTRLNAGCEVGEIFPQTCQARRQIYKYRGRSVHPWLCHPFTEWLANVKDTRFRPTRSKPSGVARMFCKLADVFPSIRVSKRS
jgi:hypothetical protein